MDYLVLFFNYISLTSKNCEHISHSGNRMFVIIIRMKIKEKESINNEFILKMYSTLRILENSGRTASIKVRRRNTKISISQNINCLVNHRISSSKFEKSHFLRSKYMYIDHTNETIINYHKDTVVSKTNM